MFLRVFSVIYTFLSAGEGKKKQPETNFRIEIIAVHELVLTKQTNKKKVGDYLFSNFWFNLLTAVVLEERSCSSPSVI